MGWRCAGSVAANARRLLMVLSRQIVCLAAAMVLLVSAGSAARGDYCAHCMEKALENHSKDTLSHIEDAWETYQHVVKIMRPIEARGTEEQKAKAKELLARAEAAWKPYENMARDYASPEYAAQLAEYQDYLSAHLEQTRERIHKQTDLYAALSKTTLEDQRRRVLDDMAGFAEESKQLKKMFYIDLGIGAFSSLGTVNELYTADKLAAVKPVKGLAEAMEKFISSSNKKGVLTRQSNLIADLKFAGALRDGVVTNGPQVVKALVEDDSAKEVGAAVQLVADTGLKATKVLLAAKPALAAEVSPALSASAARSGYLMLVAPTLDAVLLAHTFHRLNQAEERIQAVDKLEQTWNTRIKAAGNELHSTERRLKLAETEISCQKKVAELYARIEAAKKD